MAIEFEVQPHGILPGVQIVAVKVNGEFAGAIYPLGEDGIKLVSAHMVEKSAEPDFGGQVAMDPGTEWPPIPAVLVKFQPSPYTIVGDRIIRQEPSDS